MFERIFTKFANAIARWTGSPVVFLAGCGAILAWLVSGPFLHYSDTWQLLINTSTTIITFLMVLLIQNTQNRDNAAIQAKLDELIRASKSRNHFIGLEHQTETEIGHVRQEVEQHATGVQEAKQEAHEALQVAEAANAKADKAKTAANKTPAKRASSR